MGGFVFAILSAFCLRTKVLPHFQGYSILSLVDCKKRFIRRFSSTSEENFFLGECVSERGRIFGRERVLETGRVFG